MWSAINSFDIYAIVIIYTAKKLFCKNLIPVYMTGYKYNRYCNLSLGHLYLFMNI